MSPHGSGYLCHGWDKRELELEDSRGCCVTEGKVLLNEINYSQLMQYEILEKLVTFIPK